MRTPNCCALFRRAHPLALTLFYCSVTTAGSAAAAPLPRGDKEVVIGGFLGVSVRPGTQMVRKKDDKLHHSYEVRDGCGECGSILISMNVR